MILKGSPNEGLCLTHDMMLFGGAGARELGSSLTEEESQYFQGTATFKDWKSWP